MEQFKCLCLDNIVISDSFAHLPSGLETLMNQLPDEYKTNLKSLAKKYVSINYKELTGKDSLPIQGSLQYLALQEYEKKYDEGMKIFNY